MLLIDGGPGVGVVSVGERVVEGIGVAVLVFTGPGVLVGRGVQVRWIPGVRNSCQYCLVNVNAATCVASSIWFLDIFVALYACSVDSVAFRLGEEEGFTVFSSARAVEVEFGA